MTRGAMKKLLVLILSVVFSVSNLDAIFFGVDQSSALGFLKTKSADAAVVARVQSKTGGNGGATTVSATWNNATIAGNLRVAILSVRGGSGTTITPPAGQGWTLAVRVNNGTTLSTAIYYAQNATSVSGASTWTLSPSSKAALHIAEYSGIEITTALDKTASSTGSGVTVSSGTTLATVENNELVLSGLSVASSSGGTVFSGQTNGFTEVAEAFSTGGSQTSRSNVAFEEKLGVAIGTQTVSSTSALSASWAGAIATFRAKKNPAITSIDVTATVNSQTVIANGVSGARNGDTIRINGTDFGATQGISTLTVNGISVTPSGWSNTQLTGIVVPAAATITGNIVITVLGSPGSFAFTVYPRITSLNPNSGDSSTAVVIAGDHFGTDPGAGNRCQNTNLFSIRFNGALCNEVDVTIWSDTQISVNPPNNGSTGDVVVYVNNNQSNTTCTATTCTFTYITSSIVSIGKTAASMQPSVIAGAVTQTANVPTCNSAATCSAFTVSLTTGSKTINSITITQVGDAPSSTSLSNAALFYDTDGNYSNGTTGQFGATVAAFSPTDAVTFNGSLSISSGNTYYFYIRYDVQNGAVTPDGGNSIIFSIENNTDLTFSGSAVVVGAPAALNGQTLVKPNATSVTYAISPDGGKSGDSVTISGKGFGAPAAGPSRQDCLTSALNNGCVRFIVGGSDTVLSANISSWTSTSITLTLDGALASYGGVGSLEVVAGGQNDSTPLTYYIYPNIAALATIGTNAAREYDLGDTDGLVMISGDHFGPAGSVTILGSAATSHAVIEGSCTSSGYSATAICVEVPTGISDSVYTGNIVVTRTSDTKTRTFSNFRILPRIVSNSPVSGSVGTIVQVTGNHFCQTGTCPISPNRSAINDNVKFGSTQALDSDFMNQTGAGTCAGAGAAWVHNEICVKVPTGAPSGSQPTSVTSNGLVSNSKPFTRASTIPNNPDVGPGASRGQFKFDGVTVIAIGGSTNESGFAARANISSASLIDMALQVEVQPISTPFSCAGGNCAAAIEGTVIGGGACTSCSTLNGAKVSVTGLASDVYHWQARVRNTVTNEYSGWVSFGGNAESAIDFQVDQSAPTVTNISSGTPGTNDVTISWDTSGEVSSSQVQYNLTGTFNPACTADCTALDPTLVFAHSVNILNLDSGTTYYYRVRSADAQGNEAVSPVNSFVTMAASTQPAKSIVFHINGAQDFYPAAILQIVPFSTLIPEVGTQVKSAWVEISGISDGTGTNNLAIQVNSHTVTTYNIESVGKTPFRILYQIPGNQLNINDIPGQNQLKITPSMNTYIVSSSVMMLYSYVP